MTSIENPLRHGGFGERRKRPPASREEEISSKRREQGADPGKEQFRMAFTFG